VRKLGAPPSAQPAGARVLADIPFDQLAFGSATAHDERRAALHAQAAEAVNEAWRTGVPEHALPFMAPDVVFINALFGTEKKGPDAWAAMLRSIFRRYTLLWHSSAVCVTPGNKSFTFFTAAAKYEVSSEGGGVGGPASSTSEFVQPSGQSVLLFDDEDKIRTMISFFTPLPGQRGRLFVEGEAEAGGEKMEGVVPEGGAAPAKPEEAAAVQAPEA
jgi:hypothetical protein